jgi:hypothetical protein
LSIKRPAVFPERNATGTDRWSLFKKFIELLVIIDAINDFIGANILRCGAVAE